MKLVISPADTVRVQLTQAGRYHIATTFPERYAHLSAGKLQYLIEASQGRTGWSLAELFQTFGPTFESEKGTPFIERQEMELIIT